MSTVLVAFLCYCQTAPTGSTLKGKGIKLLEILLWMILSMGRYWWILRTCWASTQNCITICLYSRIDVNDLMLLLQVWTFVLLQSEFLRFQNIFLNYQASKWLNKGTRHQFYNLQNYQHCTFTSLEALNLCKNLGIPLFNNWFRMAWILATSQLIYANPCFFATHPLKVEYNCLCTGTQQKTTKLQSDICMVQVHINNNVFLRPRWSDTTASFYSSAKWLIPSHRQLSIYRPTKKNCQ